MSSETPDLTPSLARQLILRALTGMGLSFTDAMTLVDYDPEAETAYWRYDKVTGESQIRLGPKVVQLGVPGIRIVLRHEILHRSLFHGLTGWRDDAYHDLKNLTLDVFINRLLLDAYPQQLRAVSERLYPEQSRTTPIALADCTASPSKLNGGLRELWLQIWRGDTGVVGGPLSLYYQLLEIRSAPLPLFSWVERELAPPQVRRDVWRRAAAAIARDIESRLPFDSSQRGALRKYAVTPLDSEHDRIERFLGSIRLHRWVDDIEGMLTGGSKREIRVQVHSALPSRRELTYRATGISELLRVHWNERKRPERGRQPLGIYVDVSGSMEPYFGVVTGLAARLRYVPLRFHAFDDGVRGVDLEVFSQGVVVGGGGTDFNAPIGDLLEADDLAAGLMITDGFGEVNPSLAERLKASPKRLFVVYLRDDERSVCDPLQDLAADVLVLTPTNKGP